MVRAHYEIEYSEEKVTGIREDEAMDSRYRYSAYYTNLELPSSAIWCLYRDRGDA